jgi:hypothetical protein
MGAHPNRRPHPGRAVIAALAGCALFLAGNAWALGIDSVHVDRANERIVVRGEGFSGSTVFSLGGVIVATDNVTPTQLDIPFSADVAAAVQWRGSYRLIADGIASISLYVDARIEDPDPGPPPEPPPGGPDCPCIPGWEASDIPKDNWTLCYWNYDSQQQWISGQYGSLFISTAFDPYNIFFDESDPGNSISYCALHDGTGYTVAEPVVNQDQFDDCDAYMWSKICI